MPVSIYKKEEQAKGSFNFGKILEHKPIGFPQDRGQLEPYSTLFYWAYAWSDAGGLIDQHPHKGFEIMSYVMKGEIEHYDNQLKGWKKLKEGDAQVIRAGNGIVHAEKLLPGSAMFQIWFDPDLNKSLSQPASYNDYAGSQLPVTESPGMTIKHVKGGNSPFTIESEIDFIQDIKLKSGERNFDLDPAFVYSIFIVKGPVVLDQKSLYAGDFILVKDMSELKINAGSDDCRIFVIKSPVKPGFETYFEMMKDR
jgi:quercetin 2,3-dioxygenase